MLSWNPQSIRILGTNMLYLIRNELMQLSTATGQDLKSLPVRTNPQRGRNTMHMPFVSHVIDF